MAVLMGLDEELVAREVGIGVLRALVCTRVYGIMRGSFDGAGRGTVLGGERGVGEGLDERWWGMRCVWRKGKG